MAALTRYRSTSPPLRNQKRTIKPDIPNKRTHVLANATNTTNRTRQPKKQNKENTKKKIQRRGRYAQDVPSRPPQREDKECGEDDAGDLACVGVEPARDERGADQA